MKCEYCGTAIPDGAEECPACGAGITIQTEKPADGENASDRKTIKCRKCKTENDSTMQFYGHCGEKLDPNAFSEFECILVGSVSFFMCWVFYKAVTHFKGGVPDDLLNWVIFIFTEVGIFIFSFIICMLICDVIRESREKKEDN